MGQFDQLLYAVLPYGAVVMFLSMLIARRYRLPPFSLTTPPTPIAVKRSSLAERVLFSYGILAILAGHILAFLIPQQVLSFNAEPVRLLAVEVTGMILGLLTLVGLVMVVAGRVTNSDSRRGTSLADWLLYALLLVQVVSGIYVALFYPWGSSWYATSAVPYLRSLVKLEPNISFISAMPHPVKLHVVNAFVLLAVLPFTRMVRPFILREEDKEEVPVSNTLMTTVLLVGLTFSGLALIPRVQASHLPGNQQGYEPVQPIAFSHRLHAGEMQIACLYCHSGAERSSHAGIPAATVCMNCHRFVTAPLPAVRAEYELARQEKRPARTIVSPELEKLYAALGLNDQLQPNPEKPPRPIHWVKVHNLPSFAHFDHRAHIGAGVDCQHCHGYVEAMERVRQVEDLSMGWCVQCHRDAKVNGIAGKPVNPSNDCSTCHH